MDKETRQALEASIEHWEENTKAEHPDLASTDGSDCALCDVFYHDHDCVGCPVAAHTGKDLCWGTPYYTASEAHERWYEWRTKARHYEFINAAQAEVDFLKMLLKKGENDAV